MKKSIEKTFFANFCKFTKEPDIAQKFRASFLYSDDKFHYYDDMSDEYYAYLNSLNRQRNKPLVAKPDPVKIKGDIDKVVSNMNSKKDAWDKVSSIWHKATSFIKSQTSRVTEGKVDTKIRSLRILSCHGDENTLPCRYRSFSQDNKYHYCNLCGCGEREMARLSALGSEIDKPVFNEEEYDKLDYPYLECPIKKPGFSNYEGDDKIIRFE